MSRDMISLWVSALSTLVAVLAFIRPEIANLFRRWFGQIDFFPRDRIEIGFGSLGPTIGVTGTLRAVRSSQFVHEMSIRLERKSDKSQAQFSWGLLKTRRLVAAPGSVGESTDAGLATSFTIPTGDSHPIDIQFFDLDTRDAYLSELVDVKESWTNAKLHDKELQEMLLTEQTYEAFGLFSLKYSTTLNKAVKAIERLSYWREGEYKLDMFVLTSRPKKTFTFSAEFKLAPADSLKRKNNIHKMIIELCDVGFVPHEFVWPKTTWCHLDEQP